MPKLQWLSAPRCRETPTIQRLFLIPVFRACADNMTCRNGRFGKEHFLLQGRRGTCLITHMHHELELRTLCITGRTGFYIPFIFVWNLQPIGQTLMIVLCDYSWIMPSPPFASDSSSCDGQPKPLAGSRTQFQEHTRLTNGTSLSSGD